VLDANLLDAKDNILPCLALSAKEGFGAAFLDISTGDFFMAEVSGAGNPGRARHPFVAVHAARQVVLPKGQETAAELLALLRQYTQAINPYEDWTFDRETGEADPARSSQDLYA